MIDPELLSRRRRSSRADRPSRRPRRAAARRRLAAHLAHRLAISIIQTVGTPAVSVTSSVFHQVEDGMAVELAPRHSPSWRPIIGKAKAVAQALAWNIGTMTRNTVLRDSDRAFPLRADLPGECRTFERCE